MNGYYYAALNREEKTAYEQIKTGLEALQSSVRVVRLESTRLAEVWLRLKLDVPLLFYAVGYSYRFYPGADHVELLPEYLFDKGKIRTHQQAIQARIQRLTRPLQGKSQGEKELAIHDFILDQVRYDKLKKSYSHEIIGPLTQGVGVCEGIAKTVKALCDAVGIECTIALSEANPEKGVRYRHTWNILTIDGKRYHLDATFDNSLQRGAHRYDYYNLDDRHIFLDHERLVLPVPPCTEEKGYYYRSVSLTKMEDVENRVRQALRKKQKTFIFHWRGGGLNREILQEIVEAAGQAAAQKGLSAACAVNVRQSVIQLNFDQQQELELQEPDEGQQDVPLQTEEKPV